METEDITLRDELFAIFPELDGKSPVATGCFKRNEYGGRTPLPVTEKVGEG